MSYFFPVALFAILFFIIYINDVRIRISSFYPQPSKGLIREVSNIFWLFIGAAWYIFYEVFDAFLQFYKTENVFKIKIISFFVMILIILFLKFALKRNLVNSKF